MLVYTGDVIRAKPGTEPSVHMANYQTVGYKFRPMISWNGRIGSRISRSFMYSPKTQLKRDDRSPRRRL